MKNGVVLFLTDVICQFCLPIPKLIIPGGAKKTSRTLRNYNGRT